MELYNNSRKVKKNKVTDVLKINNLGEVLVIWAIFLAISFSIVFVSLRSIRSFKEYEEAKNIYYEKVNKEYLLLNKEQFAVGKHSNDPVFLLKCIDTGKELELTVTRATYLRFKPGDHVWFKLERHQFDNKLDPEYNKIIQDQRDRQFIIVILLVCFISLVAYCQSMEYELEIDYKNHSSTYCNISYEKRERIGKLRDRILIEWFSRIILGILIASIGIVVFLVI